MGIPGWHSSCFSAKAHSNSDSTTSNSNSPNSRHISSSPNWRAGEMKKTVMTAAASPLPCKAIGCVKPRRPAAEPPSPLPANAFNGFPGDAYFNAQGNSQSKAAPAMVNLELKVERRKTERGSWPPFSLSYPSSSPSHYTRKLDVHVDF